MEINKVFKDLNINCECIDVAETSNYRNYKCILNSKSKISDIKANLDNIIFGCKVDNFSLTINSSEGYFTLSEKLKSNKINLVHFIQIKEFEPKQLECIIGESTNGKPVILNIEKAPHILIAGTTGAGKTTLLHSIIANILFYDQADLNLIDHKKIEFATYACIQGVGYYNTYESTIKCLDYLIELMEYRYSNYKKDFRKKLIVIDEVSDLFLADEDKSLYKKLLKLVQKSRAVGIHVIIATQRPSAKIIDGNIKANFPCRISCRVASKIDSRIVIDSSGAEQLNGYGDAIINDGTNFERFQCTYITPEIVIEHL